MVDVDDKWFLPCLHAWTSHLFFFLAPFWSAYNFESYSLFMSSYLSFNGGPDEPLGILFNYLFIFQMFLHSSVSCFRFNHYSPLLAMGLNGPTEPIPVNLSRLSLCVRMCVKKTNLWPPCPLIVYWSDLHKGAATGELLWSNTEAHLHRSEESLEVLKYTACAKKYYMAADIETFSGNRNNLAYSCKKKKKTKGRQPPTTIMVSLPVC